MTIFSSGFTAVFSKNVERSRPLPQQPRKKKLSLLKSKRSLTNLMVLIALTHLILLIVPLRLQAPLELELEPKPEPPPLLPPLRLALQRMEQPTLVPKSSPQRKKKWPR